MNTVIHAEYASTRFACTTAEKRVAWTRKEIKISESNWLTEIESRIQRHFKCLQSASGTISARRRFEAGVSSNATAVVGFTDGSDDSGRARDPGNGLGLRLTTSTVGGGATAL